MRHFSRSYFAASNSRVDIARSCFITADDVTRCKLRSMLSGRPKTNGESESGN